MSDEAQQEPPAGEPQPGLDPAPQPELEPASPHAPPEPERSDLEPFAPPAGQAPARKERDLSDAPKGFWARAQAVLLAPFAAFERHDSSWGWWQPWLLVAALGVLVGGISLARIDHEAWQTKQFERQLDQMSPTQRKQMEKPEVAEMLAKGRRFGIFFTKAALILGPPLFGLIGLVLAAGLLFLVARFLGDSKEPFEVATALSVAGYLSLANVISYLGEGFGYLLGNPQPSASLAALADPVGQPLLSAGLSRLSPAVLYYYVLLAAGLAGACGLRRGRALAVSGGLYAGVSAALIGVAALGKLGASFQAG